MGKDTEEEMSTFIYTANIYWVPTLCRTLFLEQRIQQWAKYTDPCYHGFPLWPEESENKQKT